MSKAVEKFIKKVIILFISIVLPTRSRAAQQVVWSSFKRILIFRLDSRLGNSILILSLAQAIKRSAPDIEIDVLMTSQFIEIYHRHPDIHAVIPYDQDYMLRRPWRYLVLWNTLRRSNYDVVFSSSNPNTLSVSQAIFARLISRKHSVGFDWQQSHRIYTEVVKGNTQISYADAQVDLWRHFNPAAEYGRPRLFLLETRPVPADQLLFWLGATGQKKIPADLVRQLISIFSEQAVPWVPAVGPDDNEIIEILSPEIRPQVRILRGSLKETALFFIGFKVICMPDTGPLHLAAALDIPLIQVFVNSNSVWYSYQGEQFFLIDKSLDTAALKKFLQKYFPTSI